MLKIQIKKYNSCTPKQEPKEMYTCLFFIYIGSSFQYSLYIQIVPSEFLYAAFFFLIKLLIKRKKNLVIDFLFRDGCIYYQINLCHFIHPMYLWHFECMQDVFISIIWIAYNNSRWRLFLPLSFNSSFKPKVFFLSFFLLSNFLSLITYSFLFFFGGGGGFFFLGGGGDYQV